MTTQTMTVDCGTMTVGPNYMYMVMSNHTMSYQWTGDEWEWLACKLVAGGIHRNTTDFSNADIVQIKAWADIGKETT